MINLSTQQPASEDIRFSSSNDTVVKNQNVVSLTKKANTPFYTASNLLPHLQHQEFFNAIETRYNMTGPFAITDQQPIKLNFQAAIPLNLKLTLHPKKKETLEIKPISLSQLPALINEKTLIVDVRSFVKYSLSHIQSSINIAIPNTILKRPSFTLEKVSGVIISEKDRLAWKEAIQDSRAHILFYDEQSESMNEHNAIYYLCHKLQEIDHKGVLGFIKGGMSTFFKSHANQCISGKDSNRLIVENTASSSSAAVPPTPGISGLPPVVIGSSLSNKRLKKRPIEGLHLGSLPPQTLTSSNVPFANDAFNPFFSNIRQNMELCHGSIKERFPVRVPNEVHYDHDTGLVRFLHHKQMTRNCAGMCFLDDMIKLSPWIRRAIDPELGPKYMAESYEVIERTEQKRLQHVMAHHSKASNDLAEHPFSIVAGIEKGALNRYTNVWPFEYTRVKHVNIGPHLNDYINASFVQYIDFETVQISTPTASNEEVPTLLSLNEQDKLCQTGRHYRRYISTQGPLPTTFNDFWQIVWEQNSRIIVMLTKEEEMNRIKCHRYWPLKIGKAETFGFIQIKLLSEEAFESKSTTIQTDLEEGYVVRTFELEYDHQVRTMHQFQYKGWQDFGVPHDPLGTLELVSLVNQQQIKYESQHSEVGPMVVHCSAGCGRTGAFCTIDTVMARLNNEHYLTQEEQLGELDLLYQTVDKFREQRASMVQTLRQYVFCYEAILWWMLGYE